MFLALRDIRFARGRFALMGLVVALVTLLLVLLSCLTRGLGQQSTSALDSFTAPRVLLSSSGSSTTWGDSVIPASTVDAATADAGRSGVPLQALSVGHARLTAGAQSGSVALFGLGAAQRPGVHLAAAPRDGEVVLGRQVAEQMHVGTGDTLGANGLALRVVAVETTRWYSHSPVVWTSLRTANQVLHNPAGQATALLASGAIPAIDALATHQHLASLDHAASINALPGYRSEHGSLLMIQGFLYGISALVIMAFLSVWTIQRTRDIAVLRALGATRRHVLGDSLGQAALLLLGSAAVGLAVGVGGVRLLRAHVPIGLAWSSSAVPALGVLLTGLAGALLATRRVTRVDPLLALGGN